MWVILCVDNASYLEGGSGEGSSQGAILVLIVKNNFCLLSNFLFLGNVIELSFGSH